MKKYIYSTICLLFCFLLCACSVPQEGAYEEPASSEAQISGYDLVVECVKKYGQQENGEYKIISQSATSGKTTIRYSDGYLSFYSSRSTSLYNEQISMHVYSISDKQVLSYVCANDDYSICYTGKAEIQPAYASKSYAGINVLSDSYRPAIHSSRFISTYRNTFEFWTKQFLEDIDAILKQYLDSGIANLGFSNW